MISETKGDIHFKYDLDTHKLTSLSVVYIPGNLATKVDVIDNLIKRLEMYKNSCIQEKDNDT